MAARLSRHKLARYYATSLINGVDAKTLSTQLAAYLIESGRTNELQMIIKDTEYQLSLHGIVVANVTSAHSLDEYTKSAIVDLVRRKTDATDVQLKEHLDPSVLGGVKLIFTGSELDTTIARRLIKLKTNL